MRTAVISASALSTKDLRASAYVANPKRMARTVVEEWSRKFGGVASTRSPAGKDLMGRIESAIRQAMEKK